MEDKNSEVSGMKSRKSAPSIPPWQLVVKENLNELCLRERDAKTKMAQVCGISPSSVTKWTSLSQPGVPNIEYLEKIAEYFGVTLDWLVKAHPTYDFFDQQVTYSDTFLALMPLVRNGGLLIEGVKDPILVYLLSEGKRILAHPTMAPEKKNSWLKRVKALFELPMPGQVEPGLWERIRDGEKSVADADLLLEHAALAKLVGDEEFMQKAYEQYMGTS